MRWIHPYSAVLSISGADANSYIQGQFSNDLRGQTPVVRYGLWLDHKGKVQADSFALGLGGGEWLVASYFADPVALRGHLERYIVADDVRVSDETDRWVGAGAWGAVAGAVSAELGVAPKAGELVGIRGGWAFVGRRSRAANIEVLVPREAAWLRDWPELSAGELARERIASGIPAVPFDIGPADLPNEGGLEAEAISFTKGCFTGQEVMARLRNLGQVRRRLMVVKGAGAVPARGAALCQGEKKVGEVRTAARDAGGFVAWAMLSLLSFDPARPLALAAGGGSTVTVCPHG